MAEARARELRKTATPEERLLWRYLRRSAGCDLHFRRQLPVGPYFPDFVCLQARLIVELDGGHHGEDRQAAHDLARDSWLIGQGFDIVRYRNGEVRLQPDIIASQIIELAMQRRDARQCGILPECPPPETAARFRPPRKGEV